MHVQCFMTNLWVCAFESAPGSHPGKRPCGSTGVCHQYVDNHSCFRAGEAPSTGLTEALVALGFETDRLKTGTPSRVDARTIDYSALESQPGDDDVRWFSFDPEVTPSGGVISVKLQSGSISHWLVWRGCLSREITCVQSRCTYSGRR